MGWRGGFEQGCEARETEGWVCGGWAVGMTGCGGSAEMHDLCEVRVGMMMMMMMMM
jgi:hypothetical protein